MGGQIRERPWNKIRLGRSLLKLKKESEQYINNLIKYIFMNLKTLIN